MRILLINQNWFAPSLRAMGHEVLTCGMRPHVEYVIDQPIIHIDELLHRLADRFVPDCIVWLDHSGPISVLGFEDCHIPCVLYSVDAHHHHARHAAMAGCFDHIFIAQKDLIPHFHEYGTETTWLPLWASEHIEPSSEKKYGVTFVGTLNRALNPARVDFFEKMKELIPIEVIQGHFPSIFPHAEIVLNQTVKGDLNFRVFEAMMCGAMVLTERTGNGLLELFKDGHHLVTYEARNPHDAAQQAQRLLSDPAHMRAIAANGRAEVLAQHTEHHRAVVVEHVLCTLTKRSRDPRRHFGAMINLLCLSMSCEDLLPVLSHHASCLAIQSAECALVEGSALSDFFAIQLIKTCLRHDMRWQDGLGSKTIAAFAEAFPHASIFCLLTVRSLLNSGQTTEAYNFTQRFAPGLAPEEALSVADRAANAILQQLGPSTPTT